VLRAAWDDRPEPWTSATATARRSICSATFRPDDDHDAMRWVARMIGTRASASSATEALLVA